MNARETLKLISKQWCDINDLMKLAEIGKNNAVKLRREIKNELINLAQEDARRSCATYLNAGRGNPNWIAADARESFFLLGKFALEECRRVHTDEPGIAGCPSQAGMGVRFESFLRKNAGEAGAKLLADAYH